jgi:hypothetical protein
VEALQLLRETLPTTLAAATVPTKAAQAALPPVKVSLRMTLVPSS